MRHALLFGKLPRHGDFVARGLSPTERDFWDEALTQSMIKAEMQHGDDFASLYRLAPPWRCVIKHGKGWFGGALAPSMDSAGRLFPIMLACSFSGHEQGAVLASACEGLLFDALASGWNADLLHQHAESSRCPAIHIGSPDYIGWWLDGDTELANPPRRFADILPPELIGEMLGVTEQLS